MSSNALETMHGLATARGLAAGPVFVYRGDGDIPIPEYIVEEGCVDAERARLDSSIAAIRVDLEKMIETLRERTGRKDLRVFECHLMILEDAFLIDEIEKRISANRLNAEAAVRKVFAMHRAQFEKMNDAYFRERARDLDDVERRLLKSLTGYSNKAHLELKAPSIVVADDLTPSETVQLPREFVLGFATNGGSTTSHVALLARALAIPAVTGLGDITSRATAGETVLLDGSAGTVTLHPDAATEEAFRTAMARQAGATAARSGSRPAGTLKDGGEIKIFANVHPGIPLAGFREKGARGIGLYRSEYLWLNSGYEPTEDEQFAAYSDAARFCTQLGDAATITIRVLDIGGDKAMRGTTAKEANPFLGNRSIRYLLSHREVFRRQLRAILRASVEGNVRIMYPMVSCIEELVEAEKMLDAARTDLSHEGVAFAQNIPVGAMIEVPSAALCARELARHVDFFSIGTNDLVQYTMAADRGNDAVANLYQPLNRAVVRLVAMSVDAAKEKGIPVSVCGESAADPVAGVFWGALGVDTLSMSATYIPVISRILACLTRKDLDEYAKVPESLPPDSTGAQIYAACRAWLFARLPPEVCEIAATLKS